MNKKTVLVLAVAAVTGFAMARPGPGGFHGGPRGFHGGGPRFHGGPRPMYHGGYHHHHHHGGWGWGLGAAGLALGTAAVVRDIVAPRPVVYSSYCAPVVYPSTYVVPSAYSYPVVYPSTVYAPPPPPPPPPPIRCW